MKDIKKDFSFQELDQVIIDIINNNEFNNSKTASKLVSICLSCYNTGNLNLYIY